MMNPQPISSNNNTRSADSTLLHANGSNLASPHPSNPSNPSNSSTPQSTSAAGLLSAACSKRRTIRFDCAVRAQFTLHINNYTEQEKRNSWYSVEDIAQSRSEARAAIAQMQQQNYSNNNSNSNNAICFRGLECRTKEGLKRRNRNKQRSKLAVLREQQAQQTEGVQYPQTIARVYRSCAMRCELEAAEWGRRDAREVRQAAVNSTLDVLQETLKTLGGETDTISVNTENLLKSSSNHSIGSFGSVESMGSISSTISMPVAMSMKNSSFSKQKAGGGTSQRRPSFSLVDGIISNMKQISSSERLRSIMKKKNRIAQPQQHKIRALS